VSSTQALVQSNLTSAVSTRERLVRRRCLAAQGRASTWVQGSMPPCTSRAAHTRFADCGVHGHSRSEAVGGPTGVGLAFRASCRTLSGQYRCMSCGKLLKSGSSEELRPWCLCAKEIKQSKRPGSFRKPGL